MSPGFRVGSVLDVTVPLMAWLAATPVVLTLTADVLPVLHAIVADRVRLPLAQLALVETGFGEVVTFAVTVVGTPAAAALPSWQLVSRTPLMVTDWAFAVCVSPGLIVADPLIWQSAPRGDGTALCAGLTVTSAVRATATAAPGTMRRRLIAASPIWVGVRGARASAPAEPGVALGRFHPNCPR